MRRNLDDFYGHFCARYDRIEMLDCSIMVSGGKESGMVREYSKVN